MKSKAIKIVVTATAFLVVLAFSISALSQPSTTYETLTGFHFSANADNGMVVDWYDGQSSYIVRNSKNVAGLTFDEYDMAVLEYATENNYITNSISMQFDNFSQYTYDDLYLLAHEEGYVRVRWYFYLTYDSYNEQDLEILSVGLGTDDVHSTEIIPVQYGQVGTIVGAPHTTHIYQCTTEIYPDDFDDGSAHLHTRVFAQLNGSVPNSIIFGVTTRLWYTVGDFSGDESTPEYIPPSYDSNNDKLDEMQGIIDDFASLDSEVDVNDIDNVLVNLEKYDVTKYLNLIIRDPNSNRFWRRIITFSSPVFLSFALIGYVLHGKKG